MKKRSFAILLVGIIIGMILLGKMFLYQVRTTEKAVVETLGKMSEVGPGLHWRAPYPVQRVVKYDNRLQHFEDVYEEVMLQGKRPILVNVYVVWKIDKADRFRNTVGTKLSTGEKLLRDLVSASKKNAIGRISIEQLVSLDPQRDEAGRTALNRLEEDILKDAGETAQTRYGIQIVDIGVKRLGLSEAVTEQVLANMRAERQREAQTARSRGTSAAQDITSEADSVAAQIRSFAERVAREIRSQGEHEAAETWSRYKENPEFAMFLRELDFLSQTLQKSHVILDGRLLRSFDWFRQPPSADDLRDQSQTDRQTKPM